MEGPHKVYGDSNSPRETNNSIDLLEVAADAEKEGVVSDMKEAWRDVEGWEDRYMVSNTGKIYSKVNNKLRKTNCTDDGYEAVILSRDGKKARAYVHRLVAKAFVPNPDNLPIINHKDENPSNNNADNLEWCTYSYNNTYNDMHIKRSKKNRRRKSVYQYDSNGSLAGVYESTRSAAKAIGVKSSSNISECCNEKQLTTHGYVFSYNKLSKEEVLKRFEKSGYPNPRKNNKAMSKQVRQYDLQMNLLHTYPSAQEASRKLGFSQSLISSVCRGEQLQTHGFIFEYVLR